MNARLQPIPRAIERPAYDNLHIEQAALWIEANLRALRSYYEALGKALPNDEDNHLTAFARAQAFIAFCQCQHHRESGRF